MSETIDDTQEIVSEAPQERVYNDMTEDLMLQAYELSKDSSLTKAAIADMIGCRHSETADALRNYQKGLNAGITEDVRRRAKTGLKLGVTLSDVSAILEVESAALGDSLNAHLVKQTLAST